MRDHWNDIYRGTKTEDLGWYEDMPSLSLALIERCQLDVDDAILDVGVGSSRLIDYLLERGHQNLIAADLSRVALRLLKDRLGAEKSSQVQWLLDDITQSKYVRKLKNVMLWHDRAVLHFLQEEFQRQEYLATLRDIVKVGGFVIIAAFSRLGVDQCSDLPVHRYSGEMLAEFMGREFDLLECIDHTYCQPSGGLRPFIYTRFQRKPKG